MNKTARIVVGEVGRAAWNSLRFVLYVLLLALGRVLLPVATMAIGVGIVLFLFCLLFRTDQTVPMWAGAGLAISGTALSVF